MTQCVLTKKVLDAIFQWFGTFILFCMALILIKMAGAFTAFTPQAQPTGYIAQPEISSYNLTSGNETIYTPVYEKEFWSGNLYAYPVGITGAVNTSGERWTLGAAAQIDAQNYNTGRRIATMNDTGVGIPFRYASLSIAQQTLFPATTIGLFAASGLNIVNFLRGERANEGPQSLRIRESVLGDIIHTRPYYIADSTYPTIFIGSNDGMLHAINTANGQERWAYVPSMLLPKMIKLAKPYGGVSNPHDYFVDGQINIGNITSSGPKRILVSSLGAGGRGLFALDITGSAGLDATLETNVLGGVANKILWEIAPTKVNYTNPTTANAYVNLGYTYSTPLINKKGGADVVIIGNGYNDGLGDYSGCAHATPSYVNCGGNYAAYLYVINSYNGQLVSAIKAGANGTAMSPNGLSAPVSLDTDADGSAEIVYAGDLNGTMWKFDLVAATATALLVTSPAQPITSTPGVAKGPNNIGYMVNFGTGATFIDTSTDASIHFVYGVWDGAPVANATLLSQTLSERLYINGGSSTKVRRVTANQPNWNSGGHKGWKVELPAGERVAGEGSFIESNRFYFTSTNPTKMIGVPNPCIMPSCANSTDVYGENWLMELDYLSGGATDDPFLDMNGDLLLNNNDRIKYIASDILPDTTPVTSIGDPILGATGIPVGKFMSIGVQSQPILVQLKTLNTTLFNQNPDVIFPYNDIGFGVTGGHFDIDAYYGAPICGAAVAAAKASATITVGSTGEARPATLGGINVDGVTVFPAETIADLLNGTATAINAGVIKADVTGGYTAALSGSVLTISAPTAGTFYNGKTFTVLAGTTGAAAPLVPAVVAVRPTALISFSGTSSDTAKIKKTLLANTHSVILGGTGLKAAEIAIGNGKTAAQAAALVVTAIGKTGDIKAYVGGDPITMLCDGKANTVVCLVDNTSYANGTAVTLGTNEKFGTLTVTTTATAGGVTAVAAIPATPGWDNLASYLSTTAFSGGTDAEFTINAACTSAQHVHQFDDKYDRTGVDMLNSTIIKFNLSNAIPLTTTGFKVIAQNQYLNPAVKLNIGRSDYLYNVDFGYINFRDFVTMSDLNQNQNKMDGYLPLYTRANIGSLAFNMPIDALTAKNWWGNSDVRSGLHPSQTGCVKSSDNATDGNMYQPVIPPTNGTDGPGVAGWSATTTPVTATGVRHNGALVIQVIRANTPYTAIEENAAGRPEYGWRVKAADYNTYVLAEYTTFWHHKNKFCYGDVGWTKTPAADPTSTTPLITTVGSTDPKIGDLSGTSGTVTGVTRAVVGTVTTTIITYSSGKTAKIQRTENSDGSITFITTDVDGNDVREDVANARSNILTGGDERGFQARTGRISWHELFR